MAEGSAEVAERMASELGERVRLDAEVASVQVDGACRVTLASGEELRAAAVVCALPAPVAARLEIDGVDPDRLALASGSAPRVGGEGRRRLPALGLGGHRRERPVGGRARTRPRRGRSAEGVLSALVPPERLAYLLALTDADRDELARESFGRLFGPAARGRRRSTTGSGESIPTRAATSRTGGPATCCASARCTGRTPRRSTSAARTSGSPATWRARSATGRSAASRAPRRLRRRQHAQRVGRQVQRDRRPLLERDARAACRRSGSALTSSPPSTRTCTSRKLPRKTERSTSPGSRLSPAVPVRLDADALGPDHRLDLAARARSRPARRGTCGRRSRRTQRVAVGPDRLGAEQVRDAQEVGDEQRRRLLVDLARRAGLLDAAAVHHGDAVAHRERLLLVVRDEDERDAELLLQRLQLDLQVLAQPGVERAERLVEQQHARAQHERARERDALLLAARELRRLAPLEARRAARARAPRRPAGAARPSSSFWYLSPKATLSATFRCGKSA